MRFGGRSFGAVAATGCSMVFCRLTGTFWGLDPAEPELEDLGFVRLSGASGSEGCDGGSGGDGVLCGGGDLLSTVADMWARCAVADIQLGT